MGRVINPTIVKGQIHGGVVQGVGQALYEHVVYDADGQLLTGSFTDYCMPRAEDEAARDTAIAARLVDPAVLAARAEAGARHGAAEIGRASGRERVGK